MEVRDSRRGDRGRQSGTAGLRYLSMPGLGHERRRGRYHRLRGQHSARRNCELPAAQVLDHAEEQVSPRELTISP